MIDTTTIAIIAVVIFVTQFEVLYVARALKRHMLKYQHTVK